MPQYYQVAEAKEKATEAQVAADIAAKAAGGQTAKEAPATEKSKDDAEAEMVAQAQCCIIL